MDHVAFAVGWESELRGILSRLRRAWIETQGIQHDPHGGGQLVCFRDPDNVQLEVYLG